MKKQAKAASQKPAKTVNSIEIARRTWLELSAFWRTLLGITLVYAALYFIFVMGLNITSGLAIPLDTSQSRIGQAIDGITSSLTDIYGQGQSDVTVLVQTLLFVLASLALIWALRKLQALKKITIRDAFYQGPAQIVPVLLVSAIMLLTLVPAMIGSSLLSVVLQSQSTALELTIVGAIAGVLLLTSLFLFMMFWPAYYIASLPQTRPIQALKSAKAVTKGRRLSILRKFVFLGVILLVVGIAIILPAAIIMPSFVQYVVYIVLFAGFLYLQVYLYELYRSLL